MAYINGRKVMLPVKVEHIQKKSISGETILINDCSPVAQDMTVKISSDTVTDLMSVKVTRCGKNLIPYPYTKTGTYTINDVTFETNSDNTITVNGTASADIYNWIVAYNSLTYGFSGTVTLSGCPSGGSTQTYYFSEGHGLYDSGSGATGNMYQGALGFCIVIIKDTVCDNLIFKPQLEIGAVATEYEPCITPIEYTPYPDGTVEGVTSVYPNTTIFTDTDGVIIDCEYITKTCLKMSASAARLKIN